MTTEERLDRMEQLHSQHMEMSRQDRAAYIAWKRDMESQVAATWQSMERMSKGIEQMAAENKAGFAEMRDQMRETDRRLKELGEATDARIEKLVVAIGKFMQQRDGDKNGEA